MTAKTLRLLSYECDEVQFHDDFEMHLLQAKGLVLVLSSFLFEFGMERYLTTFRTLIARGIRVCVFLQKPKTWNRRQDSSLDATERKRLQNFQDCIDRLEGIGVHVTLRNRIHVKVIVIDDNILWYGSLNVLSHNDAEESMTFYNSPPKVAWAISRFRLDTCARCMHNREFSLFRTDRPPIAERIKMIWARLTDRRFEKCYSQNELAKNIGISRGHLSEIVTGQRDTKLGTVLKACDELNFELIAIPRYLLPAVADLMPGDADDND